MPTGSVGEIGRRDSSPLKGAPISGDVAPRRESLSYGEPEKSACFDQVRVCLWHGVRPVRGTWRVHVYHLSLDCLEQPECEWLSIPVRGRAVKNPRSDRHGPA